MKSNILYDIRLYIVYEIYYMKFHNALDIFNLEK